MSSNDIYQILRDKNLLNIINPLFYHLNDNTNRRMARYYHIAGYYLWKNQLSELAIESYQKAIEYLESIKIKYCFDYRETSYTFYSLGKIYYNKGKWEEANTCYKRAVVTQSYMESDGKSLMDHQDLTNYRNHLAGYLHDDIDELYFARFIHC